MAMWGGRFSETTSQSVADFSESISYDQRLYKFDIQGSKAHAAMLGASGIIPEATSKVIIEELDKILERIENGDFEFCISVPEHETFWYGVLLSFGNKVKIIEPQEIKERIIKTCKEIQMEYEDEENERN